MFFEDLENKLNKVLFSEQEINDKVFRDFFSYFSNNKKDLEISSEDYETIKKDVFRACAYKKRTIIRQGDLFAIINIDIKINDDEFKNNFFQSLEETMFKELLFNINQNSNFKDFITEAYEKKCITKEMIEDTKKLLEWTDNKISFIKNAINNVELIEQFNETIFEKEIKEFFIEKNQKYLQILSFQSFVFKNVSSLNL